MDVVSPLALLSKQYKFRHARVKTVQTPKFPSSALIRKCFKTTFKALFRHIRHNHPLQFDICSFAEAESPMYGWVNVVEGSPGQYTLLTPQLIPPAVDIQMRTAGIHTVIVMTPMVPRHTILQQC